MEGMRERARTKTAEKKSTKWNKIWEEVISIKRLLCVAAFVCVFCISVYPIHHEFIKRTLCPINISRSLLILFFSTFLKYRPPLSEEYTIVFLFVYWSTLFVSAICNCFLFPLSKLNVTEMHKKMAHEKKIVCLSKWPETSRSSRSNNNNNKWKQYICTRGSNS